MTGIPRISCATLPIILAVLYTLPASGYSVLSHEAIVDSLWDDPIQKMLVKRFPDATPEQLEEAHGYAYGGCIIQDMGYYPFSSKLFSDLTHYVRSGDFVHSLLNESQDVDEYAFALGALAHYAADVSGHGLAVNVAVPILYPGLRTRFGAIVTYWDNPLSHIRTEFGFDVLQVARARYASDSYRKFIGFKVSKPVLERAVRDTYNLEMKDLFGDLDLALGTFRYTTSSVIPRMTSVAWKIRNKIIVKEAPGTTRRQFLYNISRTSYKKDWGDKDKYKNPGVGVSVLAFFVRILPKVGPLRGLAFKVPTPEVEALFMKSFNTTVDEYRRMLRNQIGDRLDLPNDNFDTGKMTEAGKYLGADLTYDKLLDKLAERKFAGVTTELRENMLRYYENRKAPEVHAGAKLPKINWSKVAAEVEQLRQFNVEPETVAAR